MNPRYQEMLDEILPGWRGMTRVGIIGALLDALSAHTKREESDRDEINLARHVANGDCK